ncbi:MAG: hypothetical protein M3Z25_13245 [Actinomycetota bacterium]|nr:hypothetical protein [Actinomycetota bacterium]
MSGFFRCRRDKCRDHGLSAVITSLESWRYNHDQPAAGGLPSGGIPPPEGAVPEPPQNANPAGTTGEAVPLAPLPAGTRLPGEGQWRSVVVSQGRPAVQVTALRVDDQHTSYVAGVLRMDPTLVSGQLHPGTRDPGGGWAAATSLRGAALSTIAAVFNAGFRLNDPSHNGYYSRDVPWRPW